jgi:hypothetical protein
LVSRFMTRMRMVSQHLTFTRVDTDAKPHRTPPSSCPFCFSPADGVLSKNPGLCRYYYFYIRVSVFGWIWQLSSPLPTASALVSHSRFVDTPVRNPLLSLSLPLISSSSPRLFFIPHWLNPRIKGLLSSTPLVPALAIK